MSSVLDRRHLPRVSQLETHGRRSGESEHNSTRGDDVSQEDEGLLRQTPAHSLPILGLSLPEDVSADERDISLLRDASGADPVVHSPGMREVLERAAFGNDSRDALQWHSVLPELHPARDPCADSRRRHQAGGVEPRQPDRRAERVLDRRASRRAEVCLLRSLQPAFRRTGRREGPSSAFSPFFT